MTCLGNEASESYSSLGLSARSTVAPSTKMSGSSVYQDFGSLSEAILVPASSDLALTETDLSSSYVYNNEGNEEKSLPPSTRNWHRETKTNILLSVM